MSIADVRRENLKLLAEQHGSQAALSRATNKAPAYIGQLITGIRNLGEAASRDIEKTLGLPRDWFDFDHSGNKEPPAPFPLEAWQHLSPEARTLVLSVMGFARASSQSGEAQLLRAYRACTSEARAIILSVADAQAVSCRKGRK